ncbi:MAG: hypothetical protein U0X73_12250 [Thermoanaerobaculia bacterium]
MFSLALVASEKGFAKCPFAKYAVAGRISVPSGVDPGKVHVLLFLDGTERASDYPPELSEGQDFAVASSDGSFLVEAWLSTDSSTSTRFRDECNRVVTEGEIILIGDAVYAKRVRVSFDQSRKEIRRELRASARVHPITLEALPSARPVTAPRGS